MPEVMLWTIWLAAALAPVLAVGCVLCFLRIRRLTAQNRELLDELALARGMLDSVLAVKRTVRDLVLDANSTRHPGMVQRRLHKKVSIAPGYVYLIRMHEYCKIGHAQSIDRRLSHIQTSAPYPVELLHVIGTDHAPRMEVILQDRFAAQWVRGEWFRLSDEDIAFIRSIESPVRLTGFEGNIYNAVTGKTI